MKAILAPVNVEIARKSGFRQLVEKKLGIDWEHGDEKQELGSDFDMSEFNQSLQTNQVMDGYDELHSPTRKRSLVDGMSRSESKFKHPLQDEYKMLSRKYSFSALEDVNQN